ncbi:ankyrin repeat domain-containing protein 50-like [Mytilus californianus]|uniref:ankyrin repeat domain-containing protein 50-like n=1 Tax=Mytilus californianus TaxID=6549 RepID=UPI002246955F|nr:ankyrin repeat domain-containing protein 50-like [Mytilus californianus]
MNGFNKNETTCMIPHDVLDLQKKEIMKWRERHVLFEETTASKTVSAKMKTHGFVILSGPPGSGKSAIAYNTAFILEKDAEFNILPVSSPEEIRKFLLPETKQVFVIDDPVGKYTVDDSRIQRWKNEETFIKQTFTECKNTKLILTCRSYIYNSGFCRKLQISPIHCDLLSHGLKLSLVERTKICHRYNIPKLNDDTIMMYEFLPLLCVVYSRQEDSALAFLNPKKVLAEEMINTKEKSDIGFLAIALLVVRNNYIGRQTLSLENLTSKELLNDLYNECGFKYFPSTSVLLSSLCDLIGTYINETEDGFSCIHDTLFENLAFIVGSSIIHCLIKYGSSVFVANRLQLVSIQEKHDELVIMVEREQEELYFQRLLMDIREGYHSHVFTGIQMKYSRFRSKLLTFLKRLKAEDLTGDKNNSTPLHSVSEHGFDDLAHAFMQLRKDQLIHQDKNKRTPLYMACCGGHDKVALTLLAIDKSSFDITNNDDLTPFDAASNNGHSSTVRLLLKYGANIDRQDKKTKRTALQRACKNGHSDIVNFLLTKKSAADNLDIYGLKAIHIACQSGHLKIVELLLQYKDMINESDAYGRTPLFIACENNHQNIVDILLKGKANVNQRSKINISPLYKACQIRNEYIVGRLLDKSANVNAQSGDGSSPLYIACFKGENKIVEMLIDKKAEVNIATKQGFTPFLISCSEDHLEICELLQLSGANINTADKFEFTPLHVACREKHERIVRFLIEQNANINAVNRKKESPLYISCINDSSDIVKLLLKKDADVKLCEEKGNSPLHAACLKGNKQIVQLLLDRKADKHKRNKDGKTPFEIVQGGEHDKMVELLNRDKECEWTEIVNKNK